MTKSTPTTIPPSSSTSSILACAVPPVARTSSSTITRDPGETASRCTWRLSVPYSSAYVASTVSRGSFPGFRAAMKPAPSSYASAAEDEAACLRAEDEVRLARPRPLGQLLDRVREVHAVRDQRHQILEDDPLGREV